MNLRETEQHPRNERDRALDDQRVMTIPQWAEVNGFSIWTAQRLIKAGKGAADHANFRPPDRHHRRQ